MPVAIISAKKYGFENRLSVKQIPSDIWRVVIALQYTVRILPIDVPMKKKRRIFLPTSASTASCNAEEPVSILEPELIAGLQ